MTTIDGDRFRVIDDCLPDAVFSACVKLMRRARFESVASSIDEPLDGRAYRAAGTTITCASGCPDEWSPAAYRAVFRHIADATEIFGLQGESWDTVSFTAWKYLAGGRLGWHNDSGNSRVGAFVLFTHESWSASWGGSLKIVDVAASDIVDAQTRRGTAAAADVGRMLVDQGRNAIDIVPTPNRLVLFRSDTFHAIERVDWTAGDRPRSTITGFVTQRGDA
jgi:hypothetical protein